MDNVAELSERYASMAESQLLQIAVEGGLSPGAADLLKEEMARRGLKDADIARQAAEVTYRRLQMQAGNNVFFRTRGTGLSFRGSRFASQEDERLGILLCTRWFLLCWVPLFPLGSYRIRFNGPTPRFWRRKGRYEVLSHEKLDWEMVLRVWSLTALAFLLVFLAIWILMRIHIL